MKSEKTSRSVGLGRVLAGLGIALVFAGLLFVPLGGSSTSSEIELTPYLPRSAHQAYAHSLAHRLNRSPAREWLLASERAVVEAEAVSLPFDAAGKFEADGAAALAYRFSARGGQRVSIQVETSVPAPGDTAAPGQGATAAPAPGAAAARAPGDPSAPAWIETAATGEAATAAPDAPAAVFVDLFRAAAHRVEYEQSTPPMAAGQGASMTQRIELAVLEPADYVLRVQAEIGYTGTYKVGIEAAPLLMFPVLGVDRRAIQSGFGAERDAGARSHRGVDIFAARGTPALAAMDSWVTRVETTRRGGNVVWLQPLFSDMRLYYAHLDSQRVKAGDFVLAGEMLGTVGNTGNARTTPPHLHFGVYVRKRGMRGGARDPYPFLD